MVSVLALKDRNILVTDSPCNRLQLIEGSNAANEDQLVLIMLSLLDRMSHIGNPGRVWRCRPFFFL